MFRAVGNCRNNMSEKVRDHYDKLEKLGEGTYGKVYKGKDKITGQLVALKKVKIDSNDTEGVPSTTLREIALLKRLRHSPYIIGLLKVLYIDSKKGNPLIYLVFEYMDSDLHKYIKNHVRSSTKITPQAIKRYMYQICKGVSHIHGNSVMHRDLKPDNLLMDLSRDSIKIVDLAAYLVLVLKSRLEFERAEMCRLRPSFVSQDSTELGQILNIFMYLGTPNEQIWPGVSKLLGWHEYPNWKPRDLSLFAPALEPSGLDLLSKMLVLNPNKRISAKRAMAHPYFDDLDKSQL